jgi:DNA-binding LytR/AlgR family response regulator
MNSNLVRFQCRLQYALKAFEVHAIDYLLKPYTQERFKMAMSRTSNNIEKLLPLAEKLLINKPIIRIEFGSNFKKLLLR